MNSDIGIQQDTSHDNAGNRIGVTSRLYNQINKPPSFADGENKVGKIVGTSGMAKTTNHFTLTNKMPGMPLQVNLSSEKKRPEKPKDLASHLIGQLKERTLQLSLKLGLMGT